MLGLGLLLFEFSVHVLLVNAIVELSALEGITLCWTWPVCHPERKMWLLSMLTWDVQKNIPQRWVSLSNRSNLPNYFTRIRFGVIIKVSWVWVGDEHKQNESFKLLNRIHRIPAACSRAQGLSRFSSKHNLKQVKSPLGSWCESVVMSCRLWFTFAARKSFLGSP